MRHYIGLIHKEADSDFGVSFPDFPDVRVNVTMPEDVLHQINQYAERHGCSRSGFLTAAAKMAMRTEAALRFRNLN
ncbi:MAG: CopG family transcriptional regulator, partial [Mesorhizobium sp.]